MSEMKARFSQMGEWMRSTQVPAADVAAAQNMDAAAAQERAAPVKAQAKPGEKLAAAMDLKRERYWAARDWAVRTWPERDDHSMLASAALMLRANDLPVNAGQVLARREAQIAWRGVGR